MKLSSRHFLCYSMISIWISLLPACDNSNRSDPDSKVASSNPASTFDIPKDGLLTAKQIESYIMVQYKITKLINQQLISLKNKTINPAENISIFSAGGIEEQALQAIGIGYPEYDWVKEQIILTGTRRMLEDVFQLNRDIIIRLEQVLDNYKARKHPSNHANLSDADEALLIDKHIVEIEGQIRELKSKLLKSTKISSAMEHNLLLYHERFEELKAISKVGEKQVD